MEYLKEKLEAYIDEKNKIAGIMSQNAEIAWADSMLNFEAQKADMERLVICWNACDGITNKALEMSRHSGRKKLTKADMVMAVSLL